MTTRNNDNTDNKDRGTTDRGVLHRSISDVFADRSQMKLMTHVVAGYPSLEKTEELVEVMADSGSDLVEIQIPFSDPIADGATIADANQKALESGVTPFDALEMVQRLKRKVDIPLLLMTYVNIPFSLGFERFAGHCSEVGVDGLIIPDLPFDGDYPYLDQLRAVGCCPVPVVSPGTSAQRLGGLLVKAEGFIYTTLRVGTTGARQEIDTSGLGFIDVIRGVSDLPIAAGFGISSPEMVDQLRGVVDAVVVGSHVINLLNGYGVKAVGEFIRSCKTT